MSRQPLLNSTPPIDPSRKPLLTQKTNFFVRQGFMTIALGSLCLAIAASSSAPSGSQLIQSASPIEAQEAATETISASVSSKGLSDWLPLQRSLQSQHSSKLQGIRYVWDQRWLPARTSASATSFSTLDRTWFSWYRWWQLQAVKSRSTQAE